MQACSSKIEDTFEVSGLDDHSILENHFDQTFASESISIMP